MSEASWHPLRSIAHNDVHSLWSAFFLVDLMGVNSAGAHETKVSMRVPLYEREGINKIEETLNAAISMHVTDVFHKGGDDEKELEREFGTKYEDYLFFNHYHTSEGVSDNSIPSLGGIAEEYFGNFVLTTDKASLYHCYWRGTKNKILIGLSKFPFRTFARQVFDRLGYESSESLIPTLIRLCELPILPACNLEYKIHFSTGYEILSFSNLEQVNDAEIYKIALGSLNSMMMISAWEALVLERKIIVVASEDSLVAPCCEFIRRLALPLAVSAVSSYIPHLTDELVDAIEAPFPYLFGVNAQILAKHPYLDLSDSLILDLDSQCVQYPEQIPGSKVGANALSGSDDKNSYVQRAPKSLIKKLRDLVNSVMWKLLSPAGRRSHKQSSVRVGKGNGRLKLSHVDSVSVDSSMQGSGDKELTSVGVTEGDREHASGFEREVEESTAQQYIYVGNAVIDIFTRQNLSFLCAQSCGIRLFRRDAPLIREAFLSKGGPGQPRNDGRLGTDTDEAKSNTRNQRRQPPIISLFAPPDTDTLMPELSFSRNRAGLTFGLLHLLTHVDRTPVWVEATDTYLSIYKWADDLPMYQINFKAVEGVSAVHVDPLGAVFEVKLKSQITYRFQVGEEPADARHKWITTIDHATATASGSSGDKKVATTPTNAAVSGGITSTFADSSASANGNAAVAAYESIGPNGNSNSNGGNSNGKNNASSGSSEDDTGISGHVSSVRLGRSASDSRGRNISRKLTLDNRTSNDKVGIGTGAAMVQRISRRTSKPSEIVPSRVDSQTSPPKIEETPDDEAIIAFRTLFLQTQLTNFLESSLDSQPCENFLNDITFEEKAIIHRKVNALPTEGILSTKGDILPHLVQTPHLFTSAVVVEQGESNATPSADDKQSHERNDSDAKPVKAAGHNSDHVSSSEPQEREVTKDATDDKLGASRKGSIFTFMSGLSSSAARRLSAGPSSEVSEEGKHGAGGRANAGMSSPASGSGAGDHGLFAASELMTKSSFSTGDSSNVRALDSGDADTHLNKSEHFYGQQSVKGSSSKTIDGEGQDLGGAERSASEAAQEIEERDRKKRQELTTLLKKIVNLHHKCKVEIKSSISESRIQAFSRLVLCNYLQEQTSNMKSSRLQIPYWVSEKLDMGSNMPRGVQSSGALAQSPNEEALSAPSSSTRWFPSFTAGETPRKGAPVSVTSQADDSRTSSGEWISLIEDSSIKFARLNLRNSVNSLGTQSQNDTVGNMSASPSRGSLASSKSSGTSGTAQSSSTSSGSVLSKETIHREITESLIRTLENTALDTSGIALSSKGNHLDAIATVPSEAATDPLGPVLHSLLGHLQYELGNYDDALLSFTQGQMLIHPDTYMRCVTKRFIKTVKSGAFSPADFQAWAVSVGSVAALQAFRILVHYLHEMHWKLYTFDQENVDEALVLNPGVAASVFRNGFYGGMYRGADAEKRGRHTDETSSVYTWKEVVNDTGSSAGNGGTQPSSVLNESVLCTGSTAAATPCHLSIYLATKIRDVFEAYMETPAIKKLTKRLPTQHLRLSIQDCRLKDIKSTSAYQKFQIEVCELQRVQLNSLRNPDELCLFFLNIYNTLTLHAIIDQGSPGNTILERNMFMKLKYKIGNDFYSLYEIEHAFLRHKTKKASIYSYVIINPEIKKADPRASFRLNVAKPYITFALFNATQETPPMAIYTSAERLDEQLIEAGRVFVRMYVEARRETYTISVPSVFKFFMEDFRDPNDTKISVQHAFAKVLRSLANDRLREEINAILYSDKGSIARPTIKYNSKILLSDPVIVL